MAGFGSGWSHTMTGVRVCYVCLVVLWWWARVQGGSRHAAQAAATVRFVKTSVGGLVRCWPDQQDARQVAAHVCALFGCSMTAALSWQHNC